MRRPRGRGHRSRLTFVDAITGGLPLLLLLAGCTEPERRLSEVPVESWTPREARPEIKEGTPLTPPPARRQSESDAVRELPIDLPAVLRLVGAEKEAIAIAIAREQAEAELGGKYSAALGFVTLRPQVSWFRHEGQIQDTGGALFNVDKQNAYGGVGVELSANPAETILRTLSAHRRVEASRANVKAVSQETLRRAAHLYYDLLLATLDLRIQEDALRHAEELVVIEEARLRQGAGLEVDLLRARSELAEGRGAVALARGDIEVASARLAELLQLEDHVKLTPLDEEPLPLSFIDPDQALSALLERARSRRPEIDRAERHESALEAERIRAGYGWLAPRVTGGIRYGGLGDAINDTRDQEIYYLALELELEASRIGDYKRATHEKRAATLRRGGLEKQIVAEVIEARARVTATREQIEAGRLQTETARQALSISVSRRENGAALVIEVLDAQEALERAETVFATAVINHNRAQYDLLRAVGGL